MPRKFVCDPSQTQTHTYTRLRKDSYTIPTVFDYFSIFDSLHFVICLMIVVL